MLLWGFTVDDALIAPRVAHHLATGAGYRYNLGGRVVDAVTPLGWAFALAPFAASGPLAAFQAARVMGALSFLGSAAWLAQKAGGYGRQALVVCLLSLAVTTPLAAWAGAGMETGMVIGLCTLSLGGHRIGMLLAGLAAGLRPELLPWAMTLCGAHALLGPPRPTRAAERLARLGVGLALGFGPFLLVAVTRQLAFGHAYPLALLAKPSDLSYGAVYGLQALLLTGPPWLLCATRGLSRLDSRARAAALAATAHLGAVVLAGGDWMPFYRLFAPALPGVILAGSALCSGPGVTRSVAARVSMMLLSAGFYAGLKLPSGRLVWEQRSRLIAEARPLLFGAEVVATLDAGFVGVATDQTIVDLAGVTDLGIALLPGGHTTKRLPSGLLEQRGVDALLLLADGPASGPASGLSYARGVEGRVTTLASFERFDKVGVLPLSGAGRAYVVLRRMR